MSDKINDLPDEVSRAGLDFSHVVWTPGTEVTLCNVPWDSNYRNVVDWTVGHYVAYIENMSNRHKIKLNNVSYCRLNQPVRLPVPFNIGMKFNYMWVRNPPQPGQSDDHNKSIFYFIGEVRHIAPGTTEFDVAVDVWATYRANVEFGRVFVERSHLGIAANDDEAVFAPGTGRPTFPSLHLTQPEGLELGGAYQTLTGQSVVLGNDIAASIVSTTDLTADPGSVSAPKLKAATGTQIGRITHGAEIYLTRDLPGVFRRLSDYPWVAQGIISASLFPVSRGTSLNRFGEEKNGLIDCSGVILRSPITETTRSNWMGDEHTTFSFTQLLPYRVLSDHEFMKWLPVRYQHLKKFAMFPYSFTEVANYSGNPLILKSQYLPNGKDVELRVLVAPFPPAPKMVITLDRYNKFGNGIFEKTDWMNNAMILSELPRTSVVNNNYLLTLASQRNAIAYQESLADWSYQKAVDAANTAMGNVNTMSNTSLDNNQLQRQFNLDMQHHRNMQAWANTMVGGAQVPSQMGQAQAIGNQAMSKAATAGVVAGQLSNVLSTAVNTTMDYRAVQMGNDLSAAQLANSVGAASTVGMANRDLAVRNAGVDRAAMLAGINARVQDMKLTPPSVVAQAGGEAFMMTVNNCFMVDVTRKVIPIDAMVRIGEYWLNYGYTINAWHDLRNLSVMTHFTYWKLAECPVWSANCPEQYRNVFRGIMERGVTVWRNPDHIGRLDPGVNKPVSGVRIGV